jgi:6-phosphogluconolactonase
VANVTIEADESALAQAAATRVTSLLARRLEVKARVNLCVTGGSTPRALYRLLATPSWQSKTDWRRIHVYWTDERHVPPDHPESNFRMVQELLLTSVPIPDAQIHRVLAELKDAKDAARRYDETLALAAASAGRNDRLFDLMLLGVGDDGHIASLFPGSPQMSADAVASSIAGAGPRAVATRAPTNAARISLTPGAVLDADRQIVLVAGSSKAPAIHAALEGAPDEQHWPVQLLRRAGDAVEWMFDRAAAAHLSGGR